MLFAEASKNSIYLRFNFFCNIYALYLPSSIYYSFNIKYLVLPHLHIHRESLLRYNYIKKQGTLLSVPCDYYVEVLLFFPVNIYPAGFSFSLTSLYHVEISSCR